MKEFRFLSRKIQIKRFKETTIWLGSFIFYKFKDKKIELMNQNKESKILNNSSQNSNKKFNRTTKRL